LGLSALWGSKKGRRREGLHRMGTGRRCGKDNFSKDTESPMKVAALGWVRGLQLSSFLGEGREKKALSLRGFSRKEAKKKKKTFWCESMESQQQSEDENY